MILKRNTMKCLILINSAFLALIIQCTRIKTFDEFIYNTTEAIIFHNKTLFNQVLLNETHYSKLKETRFNGNYNRYLKLNMNIFDRHKFQKIDFHIYKIIKGKKIKKFGLNLLKNTRIVLKDKNNELYHFRISYIYKNLLGEYKIYLLSDY